MLFHSIIQLNFGYITNCVQANVQLSFANKLLTVVPWYLHCNLNFLPFCWQAGPYNRPLLAIHMLVTLKYDLNLRNDLDLKSEDNAQLDVFVLDHVTMKTPERSRTSRVGHFEVLLPK